MPVMAVGVDVLRCGEDEFVKHLGAEAVHVHTEDVELHRSYAGRRPDMDCAL